MPVAVAKPDDREQAKPVSRFQACPVGHVMYSISERT